MRDEGGYTLPELMIGISMATIIILAAFGLMQVANRSSAQTAARVDANQQSRPVMTRIMDELRSTCVRQNVVPILPASTPDSISFLHETGSDVAPVPDKRTITFDPSAGTLTETAYAANPTTQNADGTWTFSTSPIAGSERVLLPDVERAVINNAEVPVFRYYRFNNGALQQINSTSLTAAEAASTVQVDVSFAALPPNVPTADDLVGVSVTDTALLRFGPPSESTTVSNLPCT